MTKRTRLCPLCGLLVGRSEPTHTRMTPEGPRHVHDRCAGKQQREGATRV